MIQGQDVSMLEEELNGGFRLTPQVKEQLQKIALTIRGLSMDAVQKADSGHPGLPLGCAEFGAYLYGLALRHNPKNPKWLNRDRFILSAGHGSMLLYSCLHLSGFALSLEEIKRFRQIHSITPGHPESHLTPGVETTTGPLGQGLANAVGTALGLKMLQQRFNTQDFAVIDSKVYVLAGDGCIMEGVTSEASSFAGHLQLDNLVVFYDANKVTLDGPLSDSCSEDTKIRYQAYGWDVLEVDGHNLEAINDAFNYIKTQQTRPILVVMHTIIGKGSPNKSGTFKVHGSPLGPDEVKLTKQALGLPQEEFYVPQAVKDYFANRLKEDAEIEAEWNTKFAKWAQAHPEKKALFDQMASDALPDGFEQSLDSLVIKAPVAGRKASQDILNYIADAMPKLVGGSADLSCSDLTMIKKFPIIHPGDFAGRNIKFGVREFAMACMATGLRQTGMLTPFVGTFLTFSDYMRNAIRLASIMREKVIYQFTHDSIFLGEDGPTHQPIEQLSTLRAIPHLHVIRPSGTHEVKHAWIAALAYHGPTALVLSRQNVADIEGTKVSYADGVGRGGYIVKHEVAPLSYCLIATGSELTLACDVAHELEKRGKGARVVSMPCTEIFDAQPKEYREQVLGSTGKRVSIEAAVDMCWYKYIGLDGIAIAMEDFGASAPQSDLAREFGFTVEAILDRIL